MKQTTIQNIETKAKQLQESNKKWHFHILTPECSLNESDRYALVLENTTDDEAWICYSDIPYMDIGQKLVKILHGDDIIQGDSSKLEKPSDRVDKLLERAVKMNNEGKFWHHHMLFPGCRFNKHTDRYCIIFEDQENNEVIESISDDEPKSDLQHIEKLFYAQKNR